MSGQLKTNAMRLLDAAGISYRTSSYEVDESDLSGVTAAKKLGFDPEMVFKTLTARGDKTGVVVAVIPVAQELDLKAFANVSGNKKVEMLHLKEVLPETGYIRGGVSPIGMKKLYPTFIDETAVLWDEISISAGHRGVQILIEPNTLAEFISAKFVNITK